MVAPIGTWSVNRVRAKQVKLIVEVGRLKSLTHGLTIWPNKGISLTLRHGWQFHVIEKNVRNAQVAILYSRDCDPAREVCPHRSRWRWRS
ncbi:hypothetical protein SBA2_460035 [Acidobacteriia bacterium SbA2]|nr:hypothetical protein SBA2_460035 [Acidobacteriia bacterium SbA2]